MRRSFLRLAGGAAVAASLGSVARTAAAQAAFPGKPIRWISPWAPGGGNDILSRAIAAEITKSLGQPVIVENRPGATGIIGTDMVAKAVGDPHVLTLGAPGTHSTAPSIYARLPYDPIRDFTPITLVGTVPNVLVVNPAIPARSVAELVVWLKANPGKANFSSVGNGSMQHLSGELFKREAAVAISHVAYKGTSPALLDLTAGHIQLAFESMPTVLPLVRSGQLRALAVTTPQRSSLMPDVPTMAESGLKGFDVSIWYGVFAPANIPADAVDRLHRAIVGAVRTPELVKRLSELGADVVASTPAELGAYQRADTAKWAALIREAGIKAD